MAAHRQARVLKLPSLLRPAAAAAGGAAAAAAGEVAVAIIAVVVAVHIRLLPPLPLGALLLRLLLLHIQLLLLHLLLAGGRCLCGIFSRPLRQPSRRSGCSCCRHRWLHRLCCCWASSRRQLGADQQRCGAQIQPADACRLGCSLLRHPRLVLLHQGCTQQRGWGGPVVQVRHRAAAGCLDGGCTCNCSKLLLLLLLRARICSHSTLG